MTGWLPEGATEWGGRPVAHGVAAAGPRQRAVLDGVVRSVTGRGHGFGVAYEAVIDDGTGELTLRWIGRRIISGVVPGAQIHVEGTVLPEGSGAVLLNPLHEFVA